MLQCWSNELGNLLLLQQQKHGRNDDMKQGPSPPHMGMGTNYPPPLGQPRYSNQNWNNGPNRGMSGNPGSGMPQRQPSVSVITTVWGVTNPQQQMTQNSLASNANYSQHNMGNPNQGRPHDDPSYHNNFNGSMHHNKMNSYGPKNGVYQRNDAYGGPTGMQHKPMNGMPYGPNKGMPGHHMSQDTVSCSILHLRHI